MPLYEYYCATCASRYEVLRPAARIDEPATCPERHNRGTRVLSVFASVTKDANGASLPSSGGGCGCNGGGACGCGH